MLQEVSQQNVDLEILVQILIDQGDASAEEGAKARIDGLTQIANRRRFDEYLSQEWTYRSKPSIESWRRTVVCNALKSQRDRFIEP